MVKFFRQAGGKTQWEFAKKLGWSQSKLSLIENGFQSLKPHEERQILSALQEKKQGQEQTIYTCGPKH